MIETVNTFIEAVKRQGHIRSLIQQVDLQLNLHCDQQTIQLAIKNGEIAILPKALETNYEIKGNIEAMGQLIEGRQKLRNLQKIGQLKVSAPLRTTLLLESIFFLARLRDFQRAKII